MKHSIFSILLASALFNLPQIASASLLVGFYDFDGTTGPEAADVAPYEGLSATFTNSGSNPTGGSSDGFYGSSSEATGTTPPLGDGYLTLATGPSILRLTNNSIFYVLLDSLYFDAAAHNSSTMTASYRTTEGGVFTPLVSGTPASPTFTPSTFGGGNNPGTVADYGDFAAGLVGIILNSGNWIEFQFVGTSGNPRIDNIGVTGSLVVIPEPTGILALGCLIGSGALLRTRRRSTPLVGLA